jgi:DNA-binding response OmpR family regulator
MKLSFVKWPAKSCAWPGIVCSKREMPPRPSSPSAAILTTQCNNVKAILVSGYPENSVTSKGLRPGWSYLPKPFSADSLLQKIREVLEEETGPM